MIRKAVIPTAGLGTIFLPATKAQPKEMLPVIDKPVIQWIFPKKDTLNICVICLYSKLQKNILEYLKNLLSDLEKPVKEKRITRFTSALVPLVPARRIYGERMLVVGDAAGMVDPLSGGGISYAIRGGKVAAKVALDVLKEGTFSKEFLSMYQNEWERTEDYRNIKKRYHLSNIFLPLSKIDKN